MQNARLIMDVYFFKLYGHILCLFMCFCLQKSAAISHKQQKKYDNRVWPSAKRADFVDPEDEWWRHLAELKKTNYDVSRSSSRRRREIAGAYQENVIETAKEKTGIEYRSRKPEYGETKISRSSLLRPNSMEKTPPRFFENAGSGRGAPAALSAMGVPGGSQGVPAGPPQTQAQTQVKPTNAAGGCQGSETCCCNCRGGCSCTDSCACSPSGSNKCPSSCNTAGSRCCGGNGVGGSPQSGGGDAGIATRPSTIFLVIGEASPQSVGQETPTACGMPVGRAPISLGAPAGHVAAGPVSGCVLPASSAPSKVADSLLPIGLNMAAPVQGYEPPQVLGMQEGTQNGAIGQSSSPRCKTFATPAVPIPSGERGKDIVIVAA